MNQRLNTKTYSLKITLCIFLVPFISCQSDELNTESAPEPEVIDPVDSIAPADLIRPEYRITPAIVNVSDFSGKVFLLAPELDTAKSESWGACDCCASSILFLDDERFIYKSPCVADETIRYGFYEVSGSELIIHFNKLVVSRTYDWEMEEARIGTSQDRYQNSVEYLEPSTYKFTSWKHKNTFFLATEEDDIQYGTLETGTNLKAEMEFLKLDGVWDLIEW